MLGVFFLTLNEHIDEHKSRSLHLHLHWGFAVAQARDLELSAVSSQFWQRILSSSGSSDLAWTSQQSRTRKNYIILLIFCINQLIIFFFFPCPSFCHYSTTLQYNQNHGIFPSADIFQACWFTEVQNHAHPSSWVELINVLVLFVASYRVYIVSKEAKNAEQISNHLLWPYLHLMNFHPEVTFFLHLFFLCSCFGCLQSHWKIQRQPQSSPKLSIEFLFFLHSFGIQTW